MMRLVYPNPSATRVRVGIEADRSIRGNSVSKSRLENRVAIVTGGVNGIGRAAALRLASEGADVVLADLQAAKAPEVIASIEASGRRSLFVDYDATSKESNENLARSTVAEFGRIDILVTAAGITHGAYESGNLDADIARGMNRLNYLDQPALHFCDIGLDDWSKVLEVNLTGTFLAMQACARPMIERGRGGAIVTLASVAAKNPDAGPVAYTASKAGVWMLTKKAARELAPAMIRVNAVGPGFVTTNMTAVIEEFDEVKSDIMGMIPMGRSGTPEEVAAAIAFLAGPDATYMTGTIIHPDGGLFTG